MKTTEIIVELVVIGLGPLAMVLAFAVSADIPIVEIGPPNAVYSLLMALSFCYVLGIIFDRVADSIFSNAEDKVRRSMFSSVEEFQIARSLVNKNSEHIAGWGEYGRIRLRVARGWALNSALMACALPAMEFVYGRQASPIDSKYYLPFLALLFVGCLYSWRRLARGEVRRVHFEHSSIMRVDSHAESRQ